MGEEGLQEIDYDDILEDKEMAFDAQTGWIGLTDKYWAAVLIPDQKKKYKASFTGRNDSGRDYYQTNMLLEGVHIPKGGSHKIESHLFAGAKKASLIEGYGEILTI